MSKKGAGDETRTRDINLGKVALYQLSYTRVVGKEGTLTKRSGRFKPFPDLLLARVAGSEAHTAALLSPEGVGGKLPAVTSRLVFLPNLSSTRFVFPAIPLLPTSTPCTPHDHHSQIYQLF